MNRDLGGQAACAGTSLALWYDHPDSVRAKEICRGCPVLARCLAAAMDEEQGPPGESAGQNAKRRFGIRGGMTAWERFESVYPVEARDMRDAYNERQRALRAAKSTAGASAA